MERFSELVSGKAMVMLVGFSATALACGAEATPALTLTPVPTVTLLVVPTPTPVPNATPTLAPTPIPTIADITGYC